jgi:enoyl-CoA hydratase/carnithine racemase
MPTLTQDGSVWTLDLGDDENRFAPDWLDSLEGLLDAVTTSSEPAALISIGTGKFYSNGLDLEWLGGHPDRLGWYVGRVHALLARMLTLPVPTVAALNGHAFGAGAMLATAHDYRVMREDRGYFCFPEVDLRIPFSPGMSALIRSKLTPRAALDAMTTGRRYAAAQAQASGLVDAVAGPDELPGVAAGLVRDLAGKDRGTLGTIKATLFALTVETLGAPPD